MESNVLFTPEGAALRGQPWTEYPRPLLRRDSFLNLNGDWEFIVPDAGFSGTIRVPFCPESALSGVHRRFPQSAERICRRRFSLPEGFMKERLLLHFGAVDQLAEVHLNGKLLGSHAGGYEPFSFDISEYLLPENMLDGKGQITVTPIDQLRKMNGLD